MQQYICKCGRTFQKSTKADTTGYVLENYSAQHECYGCPYIIVERDWISREITKIECRSTPNITYATRCQISTADNDHRACYIYSLDILFIKEVFDYISTLEGAEHGENINCVPDEWRSADFGKCYSYDDCEGLAIFPILFKKNKKGTAARRAVKERFFTENNYRKDVTAAEEAKIIAAYIKCGKEFATESIEEEKQMGIINCKFLRRIIKMKKIISLTLTAIALISGVVGCGAKDSESQSIKEPSTAAPSTVNATEETTVDWQKLHDDYQEG